jgi:peptidoglycan/LPS O-acetylase OafA/YrhL
MNRIPQLDGVRALAFLMIFLRHAFGIPLFWAGVDIFFVLSGFLISSILMNSAGEPGAWSHFYKRRALRILPTYCVYLLLATYFFQLHWGWNILWYVLFAMNIPEALWPLAPDGPGVLWSLAVEEQFYFVWPFIALKLKPAVVLRCAIGIVIGAAVLRAIFTPFLSSHWPIYYLTPFRMDLIAAGAVMAVLWRNPGPLYLWRRWGLVLLGGGALLFAAATQVFPDFRALSNVESFNVLGYSLICCMAAGLVAFTLGTERGWWLKLTTAKPVRWIGTISYTGYLVHAGALGLITPFASEWLNVSAAFAFTLGYASLSWVILEKPILRAGASSAPKRPAVAESVNRAANS